MNKTYFVILYRMYRSWLTESFNIVNTPITLLFSKKWVPHLTEDDNNLYTHVQVLIWMPTWYCLHFHTHTHTYRSITKTMVSLG